MSATWRRRLFEILSWPSLAIGTAATTVAGATNVSVGGGEDGWNEADTIPGPALPNTLNKTATDRYAAHSSHRSHGSHGSHRSSGGGGGRITPSPVPRSPVVVPEARRNQPSTVPKPSSQDLSLMTVRVQAALMRLGFYDGDIDGLLGPKTRAALIAYQKANGIPQTGRMDIVTLSELGISIP